ncbi:arylamine N-acetyltransferase [Lysinibacillus sp. NPDC092081]|uniref:arylamine N-acetyltransferase family protein n=1 Tax=Lysinibacillus sp. NPDC092081 TaxID=3364131 RepID=UPI003818C647
MDEETIHQNLIKRKLGGMCTELNYSFYCLLRSLNFNVKIISGYVKRSYFDHMILLVKLDKEYLVDVGFGAYFFRTPIPLDGNPVNDISGSFRVHRTEQEHFELQKKVGSDWVRQYSFYTTAREFDEFLEAWEWFNTSPNPFSLNTICRIDTPQGNISLYNDELTIIKNQHNNQKKLNTQNSDGLLKEYFGLDYIINNSK